MATPSDTADSPHKTFRVNSPYATAKGDLTDNRAELRSNMHRKITCITYDEFMLEFLQVPKPTQSSSPSFLSSRPAIPNPWNSVSSKKTSSRWSTKRPPASSMIVKMKPRESNRNPFSEMDDPASEVDMYDKITSALNRAKICKEYTFVPTPHKSDTNEESREAVDCGMYPNSALGKLEIAPDNKFGRTVWSLVEIAIECKMHATGGDPFDQTIDIDEPIAVGRRAVFGQILSYANHVFRHQHRTCQYMLLFLGDFARIVRIDRSGIFATEKFSYREEGAKLAKFLRCYIGRSAADRGHDTTAVRLDPESDEAKRMRARVEHLEEEDYVGKQFQTSLDSEWPWWKLEVTDEHNKGQKRYFLVGKPHFQAPGVAGRTTRGYVALDADITKNDFVYLKDAWRVVSDSIDKEGVILEVLRTHEIAFVPTLICHGDVPGQETKTQEVWPRYHPDKKCHLKHHQHYRLVVKEVGKPLEEFVHGRQLFTAIFCALTAHEEAYKLGIIHRDISAGNILIYREPASGDWVGLLNDWELSKKLVDQTEEGRQPDRTGTWQFLSVNALNNRYKTIVVPDELESFFHVSLYMALRLLPHNCVDSEVPRLLHDYFDDYSPHSTGRVCGHVKKTAMSDGRVDLSTYSLKKDGKILNLRFKWPGANPEGKEYPPQKLFTTFLSWFSAAYTLAQETEDAVQKKGKVAKIVETTARGALAKALSSAQETSADPNDSMLSPSSKRSREVLKMLAKNLETHGAMRRELAYALDNMEWPDDRGTDKKPDDDWVYPKDQVPVGSKRGSSFIDGASTSSRATKIQKSVP
ncbi:hypothetical protein VTO73DRAFT_12449 [Trametes versicolor]